MANSSGATSVFMMSDVTCSGALLVLKVRMACLVPDLLFIGLKAIMLFLFMLNFLANSAFERCVSMMPLLVCCVVLCVLRDLRACCWLVVVYRRSGRPRLWLMKWLALESKAFLMVNDTDWRPIIGAEWTPLLPM